MAASPAGTTNAAGPKVMCASKAKRSPSVREVAGERSAAPGGTGREDVGEASVCGQAALEASARSCGSGALGNTEDSLTGGAAACAKAS